MSTWYSVTELLVYDWLQKEAVVKEAMATVTVMAEGDTEGDTAMDMDTDMDIVARTSANTSVATSIRSVTRRGRTLMG